MLDEFGTAVLAGYRIAECRATAEELRLLRDIQAGRGRRTGLSLGEFVRDRITALTRRNPLLALRAHGQRDHVRG
jgi:hypothetical protein